MEGRNNFSSRGRGRGRRGDQPRGNRGRGGIRGRDRGRGEGDRGRKKKPEREYVPKKHIIEKKNYKNNKYKNKGKNGIHFSYPKLEEINKKDDNEIIQFFMEYKDITEVFENTIFKNDMIDLMTEILMKVSKINSELASNILYQILKNTSFNNNIKQRLYKEEYYNHNYLIFILDLILLNDKLIDKFTDDSIRIKYGEISEYVDMIKEISKGNQYNENINIVNDIIKNMDKLIDKEKHKKLIEVEQKEKEREMNKINYDNSNEDNIPIDYKNKDIYLSIKDFNEKKVLRIAPHKKSGPYTSYDRYINTMFYLEYQDCYKDLKETINYLQLNKSINNMDTKELYQLSKEFSNIYFYLEGEIRDLELDREGAIITVDFRTHLYKMIKFTKRMITGSLVILTDNNFNNYLLTTVYFNPYVDKKINDKSKSDMWLPKFPYYRIKLSLININLESFEFITKNKEHLQIFESKAYFESYVHVMRRLKELSIPDLPFKNELIDADFVNLNFGEGNNYKYYYSHEDNEMYLYPYRERYPKEFKNLFDKSQLLAIQNSLLNRIALIQGPPGTGKTHVGTILTNILLQNMNDNAQILVVCFTNHALDSFIEDILKYTDDIVRIGGRCQNEKVAQHILNNKLKKSSKKYKQIANDLDSIGENMGNVTSLINNRRKVSLGIVKKYFTKLFDKVINDFFMIIEEIIKTKYKKNLVYKKINWDEIYKEIYIFWNLIDAKGKKNTPDDIISKIFNNSNIYNIFDKNKINHIYKDILKNFKGYDIDNLELLQKLNNKDFMKEANNEKEEINNKNNQNEDVNKNEENGDINKNKQNEDVKNNQQNEDANQNKQNEDANQNKQNEDVNQNQQNEDVNQKTVFKENEDNRQNKDDNLNKQNENNIQNEQNIDDGQNNIIEGNNKNNQFEDNNPSNHIKSDNQNKQNEDDDKNKQNEGNNLNIQNEDDNLNKQNEDNNQNKLNEDDNIKNLIEDDNINNLIEDDDLNKQIVDDKLNKQNEDDKLNKLIKDDNLNKQIEENNQIKDDNQNKQNEDNNQNKKIEDNNIIKQSEEEEEEDDEEEIDQNLDRINYMDIDFEEKHNNNYIEEELYDENIDNLSKFKLMEDAKFNYLLDSDINFFRIGPSIIKLIINYMKNKLLGELNDYNEDLITFSNLLNQKKEILSMSDAEAIKQYKIVAMTTTGCAKYSTILEQSNFEIIIIEEAAEVLESHVLSLLTKNTKRLILIGDHKQLKPKPYNYEIETKYNFNVSMFERLINNNIPFSSLKYQRRMKPKFAEFVRIIYGEAEYIDHEDVFQRPNVKGIENDMYFITHNRYEGENSGLKSKFNDYEAKYLVKLCKYLLQQGYKTNQITILTFYLGQVMIIKKYLKENLNEYKEIRVSSVDNYQGEECDIILLSLVRSNKEYKIGFLKTFNRVCVAFSRAKIGLYIIGNINCIIEGEKLRKNKNKKNIDIKMLDVWQKIEAKAKELNIIGEELTLICQNHKNKTIIKNEKDFAKCPEGGCQNICKIRMDCGHVCEKICHVYDCNEIECLKPCQRINKNCQQSIKHKCTKICWEECGPCEVLVDKELPCGHIQRTKCCEEPRKCEVMVDKKLPCGHIQKIKCYKKPKICEVLVDKELICGHIQNIKCYEQPKKCEVIVEKLSSCGHFQKVKCCEQPNPYTCGELVDKKLRCGHIQKVKCCERPKLCVELVDKKLKCGHIQNIKCYEKPKICEVIVEKLSPCGHFQKVKCYEEPNPYICEEIVDKKLRCGHTQKIKCCEKPKKCEVLVNKTLICGHVQNIKCCEKPKICEVIVAKLSSCGHFQKVKCYEDPNQYICLELVDKKLPCGHIQRIKCCEKPKICEELVDKKLKCGHIQRIKCCEKPKICEVLVDKKLKCGHIQKDIKCCDKPKICKELVDKKLKCGHIQKNVICSKKPSICKEIVNKSLTCGHIKKECFCYENPNNIICHEKCERKLKCGHPCKIKCYQKCEIQLCLERIPYRIKKCNHNNYIECFLSSYPLKIICQEPCLEKLPCGHLCAGTCGRCLQGTLHIRCHQKCLNTLICGHLCSQDCSSECICEEKCEKKCTHKKCNKKCYDVCENCEEKCSRECRHSYCLEECEEICDRKPCNKRCEKLMKCGHQCFGLCGEKCPDICEICTKQYKNIIFQDDKEILLYKTYCDHVFTLKEIDKVFDKKDIEAYRCPECDKLLFSEYRYKDIINNFFRNIQKIKKESYDKNMGINDITFFNESRKIIRDKLIPQYDSGHISIIDELSKDISYKKYNLYEKIPIIFNIINNYQNGNIQKNSSFYYLMTLAEKFMGIEYYVYLIKKKNKINEGDFDFLKNFNEIKEYFKTQTIQFNQYFFEELKRKIDNMLHYSIIKMKNEDEDNNGFFSSLFNSNKIKSKDVIKSYFSLDLKIKNLYPHASLFLDDKIIIYKSLKSKWYKCPKDHLYSSEEVEKGENVYSCPLCTFGDKTISWFKMKFGK